jgi:hypothetical protein
MQRLSIALLMALYVGVAPFALGREPLAAVTSLVALSAILLLVRRLVSEPLARS